MRKICVLMGGTSNEREVSLVSGDNVAKALASLGEYEVVPVRLDEDALPPLPGCNACFIALHGGWGENGGVQAALDARRIPYTGSGVAACRLAMDKIQTKTVLAADAVSTAPWIVFDKAVLDEARKRCASELGFPCVVKPPRDGSSVGVHLVKSSAEFDAAALDALRVDGYEAIAEKYLPGRELTVAVVDGEAMPVIEICAPGGWYGYEEKYTSEETRYPALDDDSTAGLASGTLEAVRSQAVRAFRACGCRGVARVDFRLDADDTPFVLELNTSPGMTGHSLVPKAAAHAGISFPELCRRMVEAASNG